MCLESTLPLSYVPVDLTERDAHFSLFPLQIHLVHFFFPCLLSSVGEDRSSALGPDDEDEGTHQKASPDERPVPREEET